MTTGAGPAVEQARPLKVSVITLTYRRPDDLARALPLLLQAVEAFPGAELVVVDNDVEPSAQPFVEALAGAHPLRYVHEPRPGIAAARNRGLDETWAADLVVFIDDDETPAEGWLPTLVETFLRYPCTGVAGRVVSTFDGPLDPWIEAGGFFERLRHTTGTRVPVVATNNLLLDAKALRAWGLRFDEEFGLSGGSDTVLALEVARAGGVFVWCDEAYVVDVVPPSRLTRDWVLRRAFRSGNSGSRAAVHVQTTAAGRLVARSGSMGDGVVRAAGGAVKVAAGTLVRDRRLQARGARTAARGLGMVAGAVGVVYSEYARGRRRTGASPAATSGSISPSVRISSGTEL